MLRALLAVYMDPASSHPLGPGAEIRDVYLVDPGLAVVDTNDAFADGHRSGVLVEELTVASLVQTLAANIPGINRVKILVGGKERETLAGHADLSRFYEVAAVGQMIGVTLDVHHLRRHVLGAVPNGIDNHAAAHRAVRTRRPSLIRPGNLQRPQLRIGRFQVESKDSNCCSTNGR